MIYPPHQAMMHAILDVAPALQSQALALGGHRPPPPGRIIRAVALRKHGAELECIPNCFLHSKLPSRLPPGAYFVRLWCPSGFHLVSFGSQFRHFLQFLWERRHPCFLTIVSHFCLILWSRASPKPTPGPSKCTLKSFPEFGAQYARFVFRKSAPK